MSYGRRTPLRYLVLLLAGLLLAACGGDDDPSTRDAGDASQATDAVTPNDVLAQSRQQSADKTYGAKDQAQQATDDPSTERPSTTAAQRPGTPDPDRAASAEDAAAGEDENVPTGQPPQFDETESAQAEETEPAQAAEEEASDPQDGAEGSIDSTEITILPADPEPNDEFAWSLDLDGDLLASGAPLADDNGGNSGVAYLFRWTDGVWRQLGKLVPGDGAEGDWFGKSVAVSGDTAAVGANLDDGPLRGEFFDDDTGSVYIFTRRMIDGVEVWKEQIKLRAPEQIEWAEFGFDVELDGDTLAVSAYHDPSVATATGAVYVFRRVGDEWPLEARLLPPDGGIADEFGTDVALSGDTLIVGSPGNDAAADNAGAAYVYRRSNGRWDLEAVLHAPEPMEFDSFGFSVALSADTAGGTDGGTAIIGAPFNDDLSNESGAAYVFQRTENGWTVGVQLLPGETVEGAWFGRAVALTPDYAAVGAPRFDRITLDGIPNERFDIGKTYVFRRTPDGWVQESELLADDSSDGDDFGWTLVADAGRIIVGAWLADTDAGPDAGLAYAYRLPG